MYPRNLEAIIKPCIGKYPIIALTGPRQSGKTTLALKLFPQYTYLSLENLDIRRQAEDDPKGFFQDYGKKLILDEVQRVPALFSYLQELVDFAGEGTHFVLTGSHQFLLLESISQSLAGRVASFQLYPLTLRELNREVLDVSIGDIFTPKPPAQGTSLLYDLLFTGLYPRIHDKALEPRRWLENYFATYVERDVRSVLEVKNLKQFENLVRLCASHSGQLINLSNFANALGITQPTVKSWISILEISGILIQIPPYYENFKKRLIKSPKLYFIDTGLLCYALGIRSPEELKNHSMLGHIFETLIVSEFYKRIAHVGEQNCLYFWRDKTGNEIDLVVDLGQRKIPIEIKLSSTYNAQFKHGITKWCALPGNHVDEGVVIYTGTQVVGSGSKIPSYPWHYFV